MNAVIDIGNTKAKIGLFKEDSELQVSFVDSDEVGMILKNANVSKALISNVSKNNDYIEELKKCVNTLELFSITTPIPVSTLYKTPLTLGVDRLAACVGARQYATGNVLVIDAGSCITMDMLSSNNEHIGGLITPGLKMRLRAMHTFTSNLPLVSFETTPLIGQSTEKCLQSGAANGTLAEIEGLINRFKDDFQDLSIIIGGGDAVFFDTNLELDTFVVSNLAVEGLHAIFKYNE